MRGRELQTVSLDDMRGAGALAIAILLGSCSGSVSPSVSPTAAPEDALSPSANSVGSLLLCSLKSVSTVGCVALCGAYCCWRGVLKKEKMKVLDELVKELLTPAMIFYKVPIPAPLLSFSLLSPSRHLTPSFSSPHCALH